MTRFTSSVPAQSAVSTTRELYPNAPLEAKAISELVPPAHLDISTLRKAIPAHCFERSLLKSSLYLVYNLALTLGIHVLGWKLWHSGLLNAVASPVASALLKLVFVLTYAVIQGTVTTGLWVIAHECGHHSFSSHTRINDAIGWFVHSALMVPYFAWQHSHAQHHRYTGNLQKDAVFVPEIEDAGQKKKKDGERAPDVLEHFDDDLIAGATLLILTFQLLRMLFVGWPSYLSIGLTGPASWNKSISNISDVLLGKLSHFRSDSPVFEMLPDDAARRRCVYMSNLGLLLTWAAIVFAAVKTSVSEVAVFYFAPLFMVNFWLVLITFLQHTDITLPHYDHVDASAGEGWTYVRGALATIDRGSYGFLIDHLHHHIASTHVAHHLFAHIPHYHGKEATEALRKALGKFYRYDGVGVCADQGDAKSSSISLSKLLSDTYQNYAACQTLKGSGPVYFFFDNKSSK